MSEPVVPPDRAGSGEVILDIEHVSAGYGDLRVLEDVSFGVQRGEIVALLGPNGCGKTTLLRVIGKLVTPVAGTVRVTGRDIAQLNQAELSRIVASVAQVHRTSFPFSTLDILLTGRMPYLSVFASPRDSDVRFCQEVLDWFGIRHLERKPITMLSGGERQLVIIARALVQEPRVLLLDEPTTYLDLRNQVRVLETIHRLARAQDLTVLMTVHDPNHAFAYADHAVLLRRLTAHEGIDPAAVTPEQHATNTIATGDPRRCFRPRTWKRPTASAWTSSSMPTGVCSCPLTDHPAAPGPWRWSSCASMATTRPLPRVATYTGDHGLPHQERRRAGSRRDVDATRAHLARLVGRGCLPGAGRDRRVGHPRDPSTVRGWASRAGCSLDGSARAPVWIATRECGSAAERHRSARQRPSTAWRM